MRLRWQGMALAIVLGCQSGPQPQLIVVLDTNMPVIDQVASNAKLSNDAAMDSVRIDVLGDSGEILDHLSITVADPADWPLSFGVPSNGKASVRLRARLYRSQYASPTEVNGSLSLDPNAVIDRVLDIPLPTSGIVTVEAVFSGDCLSALPSFGASPTNCVDAAHTNAPSTDGIITLADGIIPASQVGTWAPAIEVDCDPGTDPRVCIPGGFTMMGDTQIGGLDDGIVLHLNSAPLRPVIVSPFYLDKNEFTVGDFDALLAAQPNAITGTLPTIFDGTSVYRCTWLGGKSGHESYPLNCITQETAEQVCEARGGRLPTEAQWEHAARGRGEHRTYPWGESIATCCTASLARWNNGCGDFGPEPIGSHMPSMACGGVGDVSRDGVIDMGGSMGEHTLDSLAPYTDPCWQSIGPLHDPVCMEQGSHVFRGGSWKSGLFAAISAIRFTDLGALEDVGFRCAYAKGSP